MAPDICLTAEMVSAGVDELREARFGDDLRDLITSIYLAMENERVSGGLQSAGDFNHPSKVGERNSGDAWGRFVGQFLA